MLIFFRKYNGNLTKISAKKMKICAQTERSERNDVRTLHLNWCWSEDALLLETIEDARWHAQLFEMLDRRRKVVAFTNN